VNIVTKLRAFVSAFLRHFHDQESPKGSAADGSNEAEYDDRPSMSPFVQEEQRLERLPHQRPSQDNDDNTLHQHELVKWTRNLAYTTGGLAIATVLVACFAGWQAWETRSAGVDTRNAVEATNRLATETKRVADEAKRSADNAIETAERQLRAYVGITGDILLSCYSCTLDTFRPFSPAPQHLMDNKLSFDVTNGGQTPAYDVSIEDSYYSTKYDGKLPNGFTYPIFQGTQHFVGFNQTIENGMRGYLNPHDSSPTSGPIQHSVVDLIIKAKHHMITLFYYGNIHYTDVFQKRRITPFCFEYLPDLPRDQQFVDCEEHNTPPKDG